MISDVTKLVVSEMHKVFSKGSYFFIIILRFKMKTLDRIEKVLLAWKILCSKIFILYVLIKFREISFIPTSSDIQATEEVLAKPSTEVDQLSTSPKSEEIKTNEDEILKNLMRVQGALTTLTQTLQV